MGEPIPQQQPDDTFERIVARAEELTRHFEQHPNEAVREDVFELLQAIDLIHRDAILSLVEIVIRSGNHDLIHRAAEDPKVSTLLQLYGVLPLPELVRWQETLDTVRPALKEQNAEVELLNVTDGMPHLRLKGAFTVAESGLRQTVQESISAAFGSYQSVKWEPRERPHASPRFVPITEIQPAKRQHWIELTGANEIAVSDMRRIEVRGTDIIACRSESGFHAFPNACPGSALPLHMGRISGETLHCPWHACAFDVRTGKRTAGSGQDLPPLTVRIEKGHVQLSIWE
jgi:nitrite reductase/ring-hydroxylating ferredoxin subunit